MKRFSVWINFYFIRIYSIIGLFIGTRCKPSVFNCYFSRIITRSFFPSKILISDWYHNFRLYYFCLSCVHIKNNLFSFTTWFPWLKRTFPYENNIFCPSIFFKLSDLMEISPYFNRPIRCRHWFILNINRWFISLEFYYHFITFWNSWES